MSTNDTRRGVVSQVSSLQVVCGECKTTKLQIPTRRRILPEGDVIDSCLYFNWGYVGENYHDDAAVVELQYKAGEVVKIDRAEVTRGQVLERFADGGTVVPEFSDSIVWICENCLAKRNNNVLPTKSDCW